MITLIIGLMCWYFFTEEERACRRHQIPSVALNVFWELMLEAFIIYAIWS